jgi:amylosucrase
VFQANPMTGDRRISGSLASLAGLEVALERGDDEAAAVAVRRILLLHHLILTFGGIPLVYMGDEIGLRNDPAYAEDPDLAGDNRWLHRPRMDWAAADRRTDPGSIEARIFSELQRLVRLRAETPELHAQAAAEAIWHDDPRLFMLLRTSARGDLLVLANVAPHAFDAILPPGWDRVVDLVTGEGAEWQVGMSEYQVRWLRRA